MGTKTDETIYSFDVFAKMETAAYPLVDGALTAETVRAERMAGRDMGLARERADKPAAAGAAGSAGSANLTNAKRRKAFVRK
jgi:hypothetical protein